MSVAEPFEVMIDRGHGLLRNFGVLEIQLRRRRSRDGRKMVEWQFLQHA
jgi:hypothetical protein